MPTYEATPTIARPGVAGGFVLGQGAGLVPSITLGVLFAQGVMYRPAPPQDEYTVTGATWANSQYLITTAIWQPGSAVTLPAALAELLDVPVNTMLPVCIYNIGSNSIQIGQTVTIQGCPRAGYNGAGIVVALSSGHVAVYWSATNPGTWQTTSNTTPLGASNVPTLAAGVATVTIGAHSIPAQSLVEVGEISPSGYDLGEVYVFAVTGTAIQYSVPYPPSNAIPYLGPGNYISGGLVETPLLGPTLPAAPANAQSWLFYNSSGGFYWHNADTPTTAGDAFLGWVATDASSVIAWSVRKLGSGPIPFVVPYPVPQLASAPGGDTGPTPAPSFGVAVQPLGTLAVSGVSFSDLTNAVDVTAGTLTIYYVDETTGVLGTTAAAMLAGDATLTANFAVPAGYALVEGEIILLTAAATASGPNFTAPILRAQLGSTAAGHAIGAVIWPVPAPMVVILSWPLGFFLTPAAGDWVYPIAMRSLAVLAVQLFVTNGAGNSPTTTNNYTSALTDGRLRVLSGGQITFSVPGQLAIQSNAAPPARLPQTTSVRDIFAQVQQPSVGADIQCAVKANGGGFSGVLTIPAGQLVSNTVDGLNLSIPANYVLTLDITQVGTTTPGQGLSVYVRL